MPFTPLNMSPFFKAGQIEVVEIDVGNDESCNAAAKSLKARSVKLYALVNNAGVSGWHALGEMVINTNYMGPKRVTNAFLDLIDSNKGRIVNTSSGVASLWLSQQDPVTKTLFTNPDTSIDQLDKAVKEHFPKAENDNSVYGLSKAGLCALTVIQSKLYPNLIITSLTPGFINTPMTKGRVHMVEGVK